MSAVALLDMPKAKKPGRLIHLHRPPGPDGVGVFSIHSGKKAAHYIFREIPCDIGGRGFEIHRLGLGALYHVRVGKKSECECECLGYLAHSHCKHLAGLLALIAKGLL
jgi:hypothetical protein